MGSNYLKTALFVAAGIAVGIAFAKFRTDDFHHAMLVLKKGPEPKTLYVSRNDGRQVLALSVKNLQGAKDIEVKMAGARVQSWFPPVVPLPFRTWMDVDGGKLRGVEIGDRIPLYIISERAVKCGDMEIIDSSSGALIRKVHVMRGEYNGGHH